MRLIGQFAADHAFLPESIELYRQRGLGMQYTGTGPRSYFPTNEAWRAFVEFAKLVNQAEPFASRSTSGDTHAALVHAFADILSARLPPETCGVRITI